MSMDLAASAFFDTQSHVLQMNSSCLDRIPEEESEIVRFIRTPEGKGVGALRVGGGGEIWQIRERGTKLIRSGSWGQADFVVVLANGQLSSSILWVVSLIFICQVMHLPHTQSQVDL
jgi:hypothetical protein